MKKILLFLSVVLLSGVATSQEMIYDEAGAQRIKSNRVEAILGEDIRGHANTTIILDASRSKPTNGTLTYEWSFSPNLLFQDDYNYDQSDSVIPYSQEELGEVEVRTSIKKIITRNKFIEVDIPESEPGFSHKVVLRVQNQRGSFDMDSVIITVDAPINDDFQSEFSNLSSGEEELSYSVYDEAEEYRQPLTETVINADHLTIQPINKSRLNTMEIEIINSYIYDFLNGRGLNNILNPNRKIPKEMRINKLYERSKTQPDTVLIVYMDTVSVKEDLSMYQSSPVDTVLTENIVSDSIRAQDTSFVFRRYETITSIDTLYYTEVVDTTLAYNFECKNFDCAAENAFLEQAGRVLAWGINDYSEFELHYFELKDIYDNEPLSYWEANEVSLSPYADSTLRYPTSLGIDNDGSLVVVSGNRQRVNKLGFDLLPKNILFGNTYNKEFLYPAGLCAGYLGEIYVTDKSEHAVHKIYEGELNTIYKAKSDEEGNIISGEPTLPTSVRMDPEGNLVVLFTGDGSVHQFDPKGARTVLLESGKIIDPTDIALTSDGGLFVTSTYHRQVFQVAMDGSVIAVAGNESSIATSVDGVLALESYLGNPISIDFDALNRLYIADNMFGSIRVVTSDGIINTITDNQNRVTDVAQMRVNNQGLTTVYTTHTLGHKITRVSYNTLASSSQFNYIKYPHYIIKREGIYGLEKPIQEALDRALLGVVPKEKKSIFQKISDSNKRLSAYLKSNPIVFGLLLLLLNQGVSAIFSDGASLDLPPDFPF